MCYYGLRYYNPGTGRFINRDPIGELGGIALYSSVSNDPLNAFDPLGLRRGGHHIIPEAVWSAVFGEGSRASGIWSSVLDAGNAVVGTVEGVHDYTGYGEYSRRVTQYIQDYLHSKKLRPSCINRKYAREILNLIKNANDPYVRGFNKAAAYGAEGVEAWLVREGRAVVAADRELVQLALVPEEATDAEACCKEE